METFTIGIGEYKVSKNICILETISLGSCVGIAFVDMITHIGGLAHIMLPDSALLMRASQSPTPKFADIAMRLMLEEMIKLGAIRSRIVAKIAGGACMFQSAVADPGLNIGERNVASVKQILVREKIELVAEDTGKNYGRTVQFDTSNGKFTIKSAKYGNKEI